MKKKLTMMLSVALIAVMAICGTLAYLTSTDSDVNVMTTGNVEIKQNEQQRVEKEGEFSSELEDFEQGKILMPYTSRTGTEDIYTVGTHKVNKSDKVNNYVDKIVSVTNTGSEDAYVRTLLAIPTGGTAWEKTPAAAADTWLHWNTTKDMNSHWYSQWETQEGHTYAGVFAEIDGQGYYVWEFTHKTAIEPEYTTFPTLLGIYMDNRVNHDAAGYYMDMNENLKYDDGDKRIEDIEVGSTVDILVLSQAVQADGFADAQTALDTAFGDVTVENAVEWFGGMEAPVIVSEATDLTAAFANKESVALSGTVDGNELIYPYGETYSDYTAEYYAKSVKSISGGTLVMDNNRYDGLFAFNVGEITNMTINGINRNTLTIQNSNVSTTIENISVKASGGSAVTVENGNAGVTMNDVIVSQNGVGEGVPDYLNCALFVSANSKVIINDGSYTSETGYAIRMAGSGPSVVTINGGTFKGSLYVASQNGDSMIINGGTFSVNPDTIEGITINGHVVNNSDGTWTVK